MEFDWEELQRELKALSLDEKVGAEINKKYTDLVNDFTKDKFPEWQEKLGPTVRNIVASNKEYPEAAAEALILVILQIVHQLAKHEVLLGYGERFNGKVIDTIEALDKRTTGLIQALAKKGILANEDLPI